MINDLSKSRILLVNVGDIRSKRIYREYPLGLGYIGTILSNHSASVVIYDFSLEKVSIEEILHNFQPSIIGLSFLSTSWPIARDLIGKLRSQFNGWIIAGGIHSTLFPEEVLNTGVDVVLLGEGETSIVKLVKTLQNGLKEKLAAVPGMAFLHNKEVVITENNPPIMNLDIIPFIDRDLFHDLTLYSHHSMIISRGCPYSCKFCCNWGVGVKKCRSRSPKNVVEEITYLIERYQAKTIYFADDLFFFNNSQRMEFCDLILSNEIKFKWVVQLRADSVSEQLLRLMKKAGCIKLCFGIESGCQEILDNIGKHISIEQIRQTFNLIKNVGIKTKTWWILGLPGNYEQQLESFNSITWK